MSELFSELMSIVEPMGMLQIGRNFEHTSRHDQGKLCLVQTQLSKLVQKNWELLRQLTTHHWVFLISKQFDVLVIRYCGHFECRKRYSDAASVGFFLKPKETKEMRQGRLV